MQSRTILLRLAALIATATLTAFAPYPFSRARAQFSATSAVAPDMVEEDWELVVGIPDPIAVGPQITTVMSPNANDNRVPFAAFDMNYLEFPIFFAGGMQVQIWSNNRIVGASSEWGGAFNTPGETVTWTQRMWANEGMIGYDVNNGQSVTWGKFGQGALLQVGFNSDVADLSGYDPDASANRSGASWESNRVRSMTLLRVRYYADGVLLRTDNYPRIVVSNEEDD